MHFLLILSSENISNIEWTSFSLDIRLSGYVRRLQGAIVRVGSDSNRDNPVCGNISLEQINANQKVDVICDLYGQYLSIELPGSGSLHICEVQAFNGQCQGKQLLSWLWFNDSNQLPILFRTKQVPKHAGFFSYKATGCFHLLLVNHGIKEPPGWEKYQYGKTVLSFASFC